ncbi:AAA family ATPase [Paraburkholderia azotifigens]|uniref:AAA family ATPase n=2 Tax=Paraburkholderia azotifigens TaxID=2057004 RepID=A0A5C6VL89_9BURK|nr:AAA family ATPase [Paraburkholderia azotifigens]
MASFPVERLKKHPYQFADTHAHFSDTPLRFEPFAAAAIPFRWMLKETAEGSKKLRTAGLAKELLLGYDPTREPVMDDNIPDTWVQEGTNQRVLLDTFFSAIRKNESLVFFYAKRTPLSDSNRRVIVGVGRVTGKGEPVEYRYASGKRSSDAISGFLWERSIAHSIRLDDKGPVDGFLLPYRALLERAESDESLDLERFVAFAPEEAFEQYSFGSELLSQDNAIASLLSIERALHEMATLSDGPWNEYRGWIDRELNRLWKLRGPYPGFGAALVALGVERGNLLAWHLTARIHEDNARSAWDIFEETLGAPHALPKHLQVCVGPTLAEKWGQLDEGRKDLLKLLSRFELSNDQACYWYGDGRNKDHPDITDEQLRKNLYLLFETRVEQSLPFGAVDRGLFNARELEGRHELPLESRVYESTDLRRVRALIIDRLERAAVDEGHTILPAEWIIDRVRNMPIEPPCSLDADLLPLLDKRLAPVLALVESEGRRFYQLGRYAQTRSCIADEIAARHEEASLEEEHDWQKLVNDAIDHSNPTPEWDELELSARGEKAAALRTIYQSHVSVLMGAAGTGKSTLIKALSLIPEVRRQGMLLLAPTGKARVRLEQASGMAGQGKTIAQFLHAYRRYDGKTGRYYIHPGAARCADYRTVVIDECSMLTEDQFAATLDALQNVDRLILVGDPKQLPPIGAGRPYVDICRELTPQGVELMSPRVAKGYAELRVTRRQAAGEARIDLAFANLFSDTGHDEAPSDLWDRVAQGNGDRIEAVHWNTPDELDRSIRDSLRKELPLSSVDDSIRFEQSYGGTEYEGKVYFWPRKNSETEGGAASKAESWQILSPLRQSLAGSDALNRQLQNHFRTWALELSAKTHSRRIPRPMGPHRLLWGDKVINVQNKSDRSSWPRLEKSYVANGEIGVTTGFFKRKTTKGFYEQLEVEMATQPGIAFTFKAWEFGADATPPLELAYALTVHKTQGSEFGKTFLVIPRKCRTLTREMLYTALTRHREKVVLLVQGELRELSSYTHDSASDTKRRMTNLFETSRPVAIPVGYRKVQLDDRLIYRTAKNELVRSKSEWIIADKLHTAEIDYAYEPDVMLAGKLRWPDFVIRDKRNVTWYWEHLGRMDLKSYRDNWAIKQLAYQSEGIVPPRDYVPGKSRGVLVTTIEDGVKTNLSEQISATIELLKEGV